MLPEYDKNQMAPYYKEVTYASMFGAGRPNETKGQAGPMWYGYPVNTVVANNYAGMSYSDKSKSKKTPYDPASNTLMIDRAYKSVV